uniref:cytokine receptor family member b4 n=1 Tax=Scatophagus argus TaxID=75038 RepID=UPI001ED83AE5|nr:cytokine receptor family member b4 [Scatophagus argus]
MSPVVCAFILTFSSLCGPTVVSGVLSPPRNVTLTSHNLDLVLRWDPPEGAAANVVYTAQYKSILLHRDGCVNTSALECDFTDNATFSEYGKYWGVVRAQLGAESSAWVESNPLRLDTDTIIGSPNVTLISSGDSIEVSIKDPVFRFSALRNVYSSPTYKITYWKEGQKEKARNISDIEQNRLKLPELNVWTNYCVQVQINTRNPKPSLPSRIVCESTTIKEEAPWVAAVVAFVVMAAAVALVVVAVVYHKSISNFLCPKDALPSHFKEDLLERPNSSMYIAMWNSHPPKEIYHLVSIVAYNNTVEEGRPLEAAAGSSCSTQQDVTVGTK